MHNVLLLDLHAELVSLQEKTPQPESIEWFIEDQTFLSVD